ncbi:MAG: hypothetical protein LBR52_00780 [Prevotellaceae bacterium]|jgi:uncharacterized protein YxjI|nr:hypothetical protein [Prevotellaceae bacterium]
MEIDIKQEEISIGDKFQIFVNGKQAYTASAKLFRAFSEIDLSELDSNKPKYVIKKRFSLFKVKYDIEKWDHSVFKFRTKAIWKSHFYCHAGQDLYEIFEHRGRKCSVYKNDIQIACWDKEAVTLLNGDNYKIIADVDSDYELLISFCLILDNSFSDNNSGNSITVNLGKIGLQAKNFNPEWRPK